MQIILHQNVTWQLFGIWKQEFPMTLATPEYYDKQAIYRTLIELFVYKSAI